jgi:hypothetical protein
MRAGAEVGSFHLTSQATEGGAMKKITKRWRPFAALLTLAGGMALAGAAVAPAHATGVSRQQLEGHGWVCVPFAPANRYSCFPPGVGRPFPGNPDPAPEYNFVGFDQTTDAFLYTGHLIREDLYAGQPCMPGGEPYAFRALIGYYECVHA